MSHIQYSGTVPIFWEQFGVKEDVNITRSPEMTHRPFGTHMRDLTKTYGQVYCLNLLKLKSEREVRLTSGYCRQIYDAEPDYKHNIKYQQFDFAHYCSGEKFDSLKVLITKIEADLNQHGFFVENTEKRAVEMM